MNKPWGILRSRVFLAAASRTPEAGDSVMTNGGRESAATGVLHRDFKQLVAPKVGGRIHRLEL
jgi:hypothetical protein